MRNYVLPNWMVAGIEWMISSTTLGFIGNCLKDCVCKVVTFFFCHCFCVSNSFVCLPGTRQFLFLADENIPYFV